MSMQSLTLARLYAQAIFDFAYEHQNFDKWELMLTHAKHILSDKIIIRLISNIHCIKPCELAEIFITIGQHSFDYYGQNFVRIMVEYKRLYLIPNILDRFLILKKRYEKIISIRIVTTNTLSDKQILKIISIFEKQLLCKVNLICELNQSIIGGMIIYFKDIIIDASVQTRIKYLKDLLEKI